MATNSKQLTDWLVALSPLGNVHCVQFIHVLLWRGGLMVSALDSGSKGPGSSLGQGTALCS